jgi:hypothetical protein
MQVNIVEIPPVEPTYTLTLTLTKDELIRLGKVCGNISGGGPTREITGQINSVVEGIVGPTYKLGRDQIEQGMHLTGK